MNDIYFEDEAGLVLIVIGALHGQWVDTPIVRTARARFSLQMISAIMANGKRKFMTHSGKVNAEVFREFLKRLMHNAGNKTFLMVDGHPLHRSRSVKKFIESTKGRLRLFYLPPYSPELNPDGLVWNNVISYPSSLNFKRYF